MAKLTQDRAAPHRGNEFLVVGIKTGISLFAGSIAILGSDGYAIDTPDAGSVVIGINQENVPAVINGRDGDKAITVRRFSSFLLANDTAHPVTLANLGRQCFVVDNQTVGTVGDVVAGIVTGIDNDGVWVEIK